jgi:hypothetical protein
MLWQTNRIKHQQPLQFLHPAPADRVAADQADMAATVVTEAAVDVAKAVPVVAVDAAKVADPAVRVAVQVDLAAASGNFFAKRKFASFVSRRWT